MSGAFERHVRRMRIVRLPPQCGRPRLLYRL